MTIRTAEGDLRCDLLVIGTGTAGMAASVFAANRGIDFLQVGITGELNFASGLMDLMGVYPVAENRSWENPWHAIKAMAAAKERHPYGRLTKAAMQSSLEEIIDFLHHAGLNYRGLPDANIDIITPAGNVKPTYRIPATMWDGWGAYDEKSPCLLVDFHNLRGFSGRQIQAALGEKWPGLRTARITFPAGGGALYARQMAQQLEDEAVRKKLARLIRPLIRDAEAIGFPAVLGILQSERVAAHLASLLETRVFEIPTMPPSVPGLRLGMAFQRGLAARGIRTLYQKQVLAVHREKVDNRRETFIFDIGSIDSGATIMERRVRAGGAVLATGRFLGKGLTADRKKIRESLFDLPVSQPPAREKWHQREFLAPGGHPINRAGLETDLYFRPLGRDGTPAFDTLHAAGAILAHQDWMRMKCGSGLSIATAFGAVNGFLAASRGEK